MKLEPVASVFLGRELERVMLLCKTQRYECTNNPVQFLFDVKRKIYEEINRGESNDCGSCPHLKLSDEPKFNEIKYLSIEHHSLCNMRCTYCDETYYGGVKPANYVLKMINDLSKQAELIPETVVWGGGNQQCPRILGI